MFRTLAPITNGTIVTYNQEEVLVVANSASALTWILPSTTGLLTGTTIYVTNILAGTLTIRNPANSATLGTVLSGSIGTFTLAGNGSWVNARNLQPSSFVAVTQTTSLVTGVTANTLLGLVTTAIDTVNVGATKDFVVTNSYVTTSSTVIPRIASDPDEGAIAQVRLVSVSNGSFTLRIFNLSGSEAIASSMGISFTVFNP
jgi:hypothetical protein